MKIIGGSAALLVLLILASGGAGDLARATTLVPTYSVTLTNSAPSANSNITVDYLADSPDSFESHHVSFIPSAFGVATDAAVTDGARIGLITVSLVESTSNSPCSNSTAISYTLLDASTNTGVTVADTPRIPSASWPGFLDADSNNLPDAVDKYPNFLNTLFPGLTPRARSFGYWLGAVNRAVNVLVFEPGTALPGMSPIDAGLGYVVVTVLQDPTAPPVSSTVTGTCTVYHTLRFDRGLTGDNLDTPGNEANQIYRTNPASDGSYTFMEYGRTIRDLDNDGIENTLDTCPSVSTLSWNPRISDPVGDPDGDGIPGKDNLGIPGDQLLAGTGCDPTPMTDTGSGDHDGDGFLNREDNCPLVANGLAEDSQADPDDDGIGSACDTVVSQPDGHLHEVCVTSDVAVGTGGTPTTPACPEYVLDMDNDGFDRAAEEHVGTDPADPCANPSGTNPPYSTAWPADLRADGISTNKIDIQDLSSFIAPVRRLDTSPGNPDYDVRWDISPGSTFGAVINIQDLAQLIIIYPPMLEGARAFTGPSCPYSP